MVGAIFTDYTFKRLNKDLAEKNLNILVSGFVDGRLLYIFEFPFKTESFIKNLKNQLEKRFPNGKDIPSQYLRSASFSYKNFIKSRKLKIAYLADNPVLEGYKSNIVAEFYLFLVKNAKKSPR